MELGFSSPPIAKGKIQRVGGFWTGARDLPDLPGKQYPGLSGNYAGDVEASLRWSRDGIIDPLLDVSDGCLQPSVRPGLEFRVSEIKLAQYAIQSEQYHRSAGVRS